MAMRYQNTVAGDIGDALGGAANTLAGLFVQAPQMALRQQQANMYGMNAQKLAGDIAAQQKKREARDRYATGISALFQPKAQFPDDGSSNMMPPMTGLENFRANGASALPQLQADAFDAEVKPDDLAKMIRNNVVAGGGNDSDIAKAFLMTGHVIQPNDAFSLTGQQGVADRNQGYDMQKVNAEQAGQDRRNAATVGENARQFNLKPFEVMGPNGPVLVTQATAPGQRPILSQSQAVGSMLQNETGYGTPLTGGNPVAQPGPVPGQPGVTVGGQAAMPAPAQAPGGGLSPNARILAGLQDKDPNPAAVQNSYMAPARQDIAKAVNDEAASATIQLSDFANMKQSLDQGLSTGTFAPARLFGAQFIESLGFSPEVSKTLVGMTAAGGRQFESAANSIVVQQAKMLGPNPSNADRDFIATTKASITDAASAARAIIAMQEYKAQRAIARQAAFTNMSEVGVKPERFETEWNKVASRVPANAMYTLMQNPQLAEQFDAKYGAGISRILLGGQ